MGAKSSIALLCAAAIAVAWPDAGRTEEPAQPAAAPTAIPENAVLLPAFTPVDIVILAPLNSKTSMIGEMFPIMLAAPIVHEGKTLVPAGATGEGEVIHAAKARAAGKAGELILAARYVQVDGQKIMLRSFKYGSNSGKSNVDEAWVAGAVVAAPLTLFISGGNVDIPKGSLAQAKTATDNIITIRGEK
jgi:hypothetical protein